MSNRTDPPPPAATGITGLSVLDGMAGDMPESESRRAFIEALEKTRENARRALKGSRAGRAIFGDEDGQ